VDISIELGLSSFVDVVDIYHYLQPWGHNLLEMVTYAIGAVTFSGQ
jgi:hypothetical protein